MAARHNNKSKQKADLSVAHHLWLGVLETVLNSFASIDENTNARIAALDGLVVRVKLLEPYQVFFLLFTREGIEVSAEQPGVVKVRMGGRLMDIMSYLLGITPGEDSRRIRLWGESDSILGLRALLKDFNLRTAAQHWLREHLNLEKLWDKLKRHDPSWLSDFMPVPGQMREALKELQSLNANLKQQQLELAQFRESLRQQRLYDLISLIVAFVAISAGLGLTDLERQWSALSGQQILLMVTGVVLILSRLQKKV